MAGPVILLKPLRAPRFDTKGVTAQLRKALKEEGAAQKVLMLKTVKTWKDKPTFAKDPPVLVTGDQLGVTVRPNLDKPAGMHWMYLDQGTRIRWAVMSSNWRSKTRVKWLGSGAGRGMVVIFGRRAMQKRNIKPRPGIKARHWSKTIQKMRSKKFEERMKREFGILAKDTIK